VTGYLTTTELASIRAEANILLPDTCEVYRKTNTRDDYGSVIETFTSLGEVSCRVDPLERTEGIFGGYAFEREASKIWYKFWFQYDEDVQLGDKIVKDSVEYEIVRTFGEQTYAILKQVYVVFVEGDTQ